MLFLPLLAALNVAPAPPTPITMNLYIGTYTQDANAGILQAQFHTATGELSAPEVAAAIPNPSWLALSPDGKQLLAANESGEVAGQQGGGISLFAVGNDGALTFKQAASLSGGPCHAIFDKTGHYAFAATYGAGTVAAYKAETLEQTALIQHKGKSINAQRQEKAHAHQVEVSPDNRFVLAADLGMDKVLIYKLEGATGILAANDIAFAQLPAGSGPRHLAWGANGQFFYVGGELDNTVSAFRFDALQGAAEPVQTLSTLPADYTETSYIAEVATHPNGKFLYVSNRGHDSIAVFEIGRDGKLAARGYAPTQGRNPRHFTISPDGRWLLAANADSNSIVVFRIDAATGALTKASLREGIAGQPVCLLLSPQK